MITEHSMTPTSKQFSAGNFAVVLLLVLMSITASAEDSGLTVADPWVREGPPNARVLAGYMMIENPSDRPETIVGASSPAFESIEFHRTVLEAGVARMVEQKRLQVPAGGRLALEPGGYHLMLMGAKGPLRAGDTVTVVLNLDGAREVRVEATVRKANHGGHNHHHHH